MGADKSAAGVFHVNGNGKAFGCVVRGCSVTNGSGVPANKGWGGGFYLNSQGAGAAATLVNCVAHNNYASGLGGGIVMYTASDRVINCTVTKNVAGSNTGGGLLMRVGGYAYNTVAWGNKGKSGPAQDIIHMEKATYYINNIAGKRTTNNWEPNASNFPELQYWVPVTQNDGVGEPSNTVDKLDTDPSQYAPRFMHPTAFAGLSIGSVDGVLSVEDRAAIRAANWSLAQNSPLVDKGNDLYLDANMIIDLLGRVRTYGMNPDLGAYEYNPTQSSVDIYKETSFQITQTIDNQIEIRGIEERFSVQVFDIAGKQLLSKQAVGETTVQLQQKGVYLIQVTTNRGTDAVKVVN